MKNGEGHQQHHALQRAKKLSRVELTVRKHHHNAIALYEKFGFAVEGIHCNTVYLDGVYEDLISMALHWPASLK